MHHHFGFDHNDHFYGTIYPQRRFSVRMLPSPSIPQPSNCRTLGLRLCALKTASLVSPQLPVPVMSYSTFLTPDSPDPVLQSHSGINVAHHTPP